MSVEAVIAFLLFRFSVCGVGRSASAATTFSGSEWRPRCDSPAVFAASCPVGVGSSLDGLERDGVAAVLPLVGILAAVPAALVAERRAGGR